MYIEPNTTLQTFKGLGLCNDYKNTFYFSSLSAQNNFFTNNVFKSYNNMTYQRVNRNVIRVQDLPKNIQNCEYMRFKNSNYGEKWFYCFITKCDYINDNCTEIEYEVDVMQTYFFDYELGESLIDREHVSDDTIGSNTRPEPVDLGQLRVRSVNKTDYFNTYIALFAKGYDEES